MIIAPITAEVQQPVRHEFPASAHRAVALYLDRIDQLAKEAEDAAFEACLEAGEPLPCPVEYMACQKRGWERGCDRAGAALSDRLYDDDALIAEMDAQKVIEAYGRRHMICGSQD